MFKVGDKIRCINVKSCCSNTYGKEYKVEYIDYNFENWPIIFDDFGIQTTVDPKRFELVTNNKETKESIMFKVGDKVRCIDNDNNDINVNLIVGKIYEVVDDVNNPWPTVIDDENKKEDYLPERFELVIENKTKEIESELNLKFIPLYSVQIITLDGVKGFLVKS